MRRSDTAAGQHSTILHIDTKIFSSLSHNALSLGLCVKRSMEPPLQNVYAICITFRLLRSKSSSAWSRFRLQRKGQMQSGFFRLYLGDPNPESSSRTPKYCPGFRACARSALSRLENVMKARYLPFLFRWL